MERRTSDGQRIGRRVAVHLVPQHCVPQEREVDAHLVRAPGPQLRLHERHRAQPLDRPHGGLRGAPALAGRERDPAGARARAADAARNQHLAHQLPADEREVAALDGVGAELALEVLGRGVREREHQEAGSAPVQAVHHQCAGASPRALQLGGRAGEDRVLLPLDRGVHQQAGRLVDHEDVGVAVEHLEGRHLQGPHHPPEVRVVLELVLRAHRRPRVGGHDPVEEDVPDEHLALGAGERRAEQLLHCPREASSRVLHRTSVAPLPRLLWTAPRLPG